MTQSFDLADNAADLKHASITVVADSARARIYRYGGQRVPLEYLTTLRHPESRLRNQDLETGGKGATHAAKGHGLDGTAKESGAHEHEAERFAIEVADFMRDARTKAHVEAFRVVAAPRFLGMLRERMDAPTQKLIKESIDKDLSRHEQADIEKALGIEPK